MEVIIDQKKTWRRCWVAKDLLRKLWVKRGIWKTPWYVTSTSYLSVQVHLRIACSSEMLRFFTEVNNCHWSLGPSSQHCFTRVRAEPKTIVALHSDLWRNLSIDGLALNYRRRKEPEEGASNHSIGNLRNIMEVIGLVSIHLAGK